MKQSVLISACLLGVACRYDGLSKPLPLEILNALKERYHLIPICPEVMGGLPTPRIPAEVTEKRNVIRRDGKDITENYKKGAAEAFRLAEFFGCELAILKERSPSCGADRIYDGSFTNTLTNGDGITAALFREKEIRVIGESQIRMLLSK